MSSHLGEKEPKRRFLPPISSKNTLAMERKRPEKRKSEEEDFFKFFFVVRGVYKDNFFFILVTYVKKMVPTDLKFIHFFISLSKIGN